MAAEEKKLKYVVNHGTVLTRNAALGRGESVEMTEAEAKAIGGHILVSPEVFAKIQAKEKAEAELAAMLKDASELSDEEKKAVDEAKKKAEADALAKIKAAKTPKPEPKKEGK